MKPKYVNYKYNFFETCERKIKLGNSDLRIFECPKTERNVVTQNTF